MCVRNSHTTKAEAMGINPWNFWGYVGIIFFAGIAAASVYFSP
jgi:hypothetical protein